MILTYGRHQITSFTTNSPLQLHQHTHNVVTPGVWTDTAGMAEQLARWTEKLAGGPQAGRSDPTHH